VASHHSSSPASPRRVPELLSLSAPITLRELREARALLLAAPGLLEGLELAQRHHQPFIVHVEGYRHSAEIMLALLNYAHASGVTVMLIPRPVSTTLEPTGGAN